MKNRNRKIKIGKRLYFRKSIKFTVPLTITFSETKPITTRKYLNDWIQLIKGLKNEH